MDPWPLTWRQRLEAWIESPGPANFIIGLIVVNAILLGVETSAAAMAVAGEWLILAEQLILALFVAELALKLIAKGLRFFRSGWNLFDFLIVAIALVPAAGPFQILRALRILRLLRLIGRIPRLRNVIEALLQSLPGIGWVAVLLIMIFYIFAVMGTQLFGGDFPDRFGSVGASMYSLFQVMTLESWSEEIARPVMSAYPFAWLYFIVFILLSSFTMLNLFIGIIVSTMQSMHMAEEESRRTERETLAHDERLETLREVRALRAEVAALKERLGSLGTDR